MTATTRRGFLGLGLAALAAGRGWARAAAADPAIVEVAYAGSMGSVMEGPVRAALARQGLELRGRAQGATALARLIVGGSLHPDVFLSATAGPMRLVQAAGLVRAPFAFARTAMVVAYAPASRFAPAWAHQPWWQVLQQPGLRLGRTDPRTDPQGRNFILVCQLAERFYHQPGLATRILGPTINPAQIFAESTVEARLQSGQLDAAAAYRFQPAPFHLRWVALPAAINLSQPPPAPVELQLAGKTYRPEPLVFYAAALAAAPHGAAAGRFCQWLRGAEAQAILRQAGYGTAVGGG